MSTKVQARQVGNDFVKQYYQLLATNPEKLNVFYQDDSTYSYHDDDSTFSYHDDDSEGYHDDISGQKNILAKILSLNFKGAHLECTSIDSTASLHGGILIMVSGRMSLKDTTQPFVQTFFLAVQPPSGTGYFVLTNTFRILKNTAKKSIVKTTTKSKYSKSPSLPVKKWYSKLTVRKKEKGLKPRAASDSQLNTTSSLSSPLSLECPICLDIFFHVVTLPCGHNFDQECVYRHMADKRTSFSCPICRSTCLVSLGTTLQINTSMESLVQLYHPIEYARREKGDKALRWKDIHVKEETVGQKNSDMNGVWSSLLVVILLAAFVVYSTYGFITALLQLPELKEIQLENNLVKTVMEVMHTFRFFF